MKQLSLLLLIILATGYSSCDLFDSEDEPKTELEKLPPITQEGKNTLGFLLNGKAVVFKNALSFVAIYQGGGVQINGGGMSIITLDPLTINELYDLSNGEFYKARYTQEVGNNTFCFYEFQDTYEGTVIFSKIDRVKYIISGTFNFSTVTQDCDTIRITDGRFDMQYIP